MTRVLVTGAGGPAAVAFMEAVGGADVELFAVDIDACAAGLYLVPAERRRLVPRGDDPSFVDAVAALCGEWSIEVLVPTVDSELLPVAHRADELEGRGTTVLAPSVATLASCLDKWDVIQTCAAVVDVPRTVPLDLAFDADRWPWPAVVKPRHGSGGRGVRLVVDDRELHDVPRDGSHIVQEVLPGVEHSLDVLAYRNGTVAAVVPRTRLKVDSGIAVAGCAEPDEALETYGRAVAQAVGLTSVANIQVKQDATGAPRLLEINPRFPGSMPLTVASGVNMPRLALEDALGRDVPPRVGFAAVAMVRTWQETFLPVGEFMALHERPVAGVAS